MTGLLLAFSAEGTTGQSLKIGAVQEETCTGIDDNLEEAESRRVVMVDGRPWIDLELFVAVSCMRVPDEAPRMVQQRRGETRTSGPVVRSLYTVHQGNFDILNTVSRLSI